MPEVGYLRTMIDGVPVVTTPAEIDTTTVEQLRAVLLDSAARGHTTIVVDMTGTVFCDSSGLHTLLRAHRRAVAEGGELRLVVPADGAVPKILNLTRLGLFLSCFSSLAEALSPALAQRRGAARSPRGLPRRSREPRFRSKGGQVDTAR